MSNKELPSKVIVCVLLCVPVAAALVIKIDLADDAHCQTQTELATFAHMYMLAAL